MDRIRIRGPPGGRLDEVFDFTDRPFFVVYHTKEGDTLMTTIPLKTDYTREELIALCERAIVAEDLWHNRDSATAQQKIGRCWALLKAGCAFKITNSKDQFGSINLDITYAGFDCFEYGEGYEDEDSFYIPTAEKLDAVDGKDWY